MRTLLMTGPSQGADRTEIRKIAEPRPGPGEVTIDVAYAGINFLDVMARRGDAGYVDAWPYAPGLEVSGAVREIGPDVTGLAVGQRVAAFTAGGGLAEVVLVRAGLVVPVPEQVPSPVAAAAPLMLTTALLLLEDAARFRPGETVLVHSASGGVGSAVAQLVPAARRRAAHRHRGPPRQGRLGAQERVRRGRSARRGSGRGGAGGHRGAGWTSCSTRWAPPCWRPIWRSPRPAAGSSCSATRAAWSRLRSRRPGG